MEFRRVLFRSDRMDWLPLGSGALAGTTYDTDREFLATELGFSHVTENAMDSVSDRDFVIEYISACSICILGPWGLFLFLIPLFVIFAVLYGGENYLVDCIAGCALASLAFLITAGPSWEK